MRVVTSYEEFKHTILNLIVNWHKMIFVLLAFVLSTLLVLQQFDFAVLFLLALVDYP